MSSAVAAVSIESLREAGPATEISFHAVANRPLIAIQSGGTSGARIRWLGGGSAVASATISDEQLAAALRAAWSEAAPVAVPTDGSDAMYRLAESLPASARGFLVSDGASTRVYIDPSSGELLTVMNSSRRTYAWVYYALHTLNFPGLISRPIVRTSLELLLLASGLAFGVTGIVLAVRRLRRELAHE